MYQFNQGLSIGPGRNCPSHTIRPWRGDDNLDSQRFSWFQTGWTYHTRRVFINHCSHLSPGVTFQFVAIIACPILTAELSLQHSLTKAFPPLGRTDRKIAWLRLGHEADDIWGVLMLFACSFGTSYRPPTPLTIGWLSSLITQRYIPYHQIDGRLKWKNHLKWTILQLVKPASTLSTPY